MVARENRQRLYEVGKFDPRWAVRRDVIDEMSVEESELRYWCYANQVVYEAGGASRHYHHIVYEELVRDPVPEMRRVFAACGLPWTAVIERAIEISSSRSASIAAAWRDRLPSEQKVLVERVLESGVSFYPASRVS
jgi:hypothetical protein